MLAPRWESHSQRLRSSAHFGAGIRSSADDHAQTSVSDLTFIKLVPTARSSNEREGVAEVGRKRVWAVRMWWPGRLTEAEHVGTAQRIPRMPPPR